MKERFIRNIPAISSQQQEELATKTVFVAGCGGLGGHIIDMLVRIGIKNIVAVDMDEFSISNLNRQLYSNLDTIDQSKAEVAKQRALQIDKDINFIAINSKMDNNNLPNLLTNVDIVIDAVDNPQTRDYLIKACKLKNIPLIHGAVEGWCGQVGIIMPDCKYIDLYESMAPVSPPGVLAFAPAMTASIEVSEAIKILLGTKDNLINKLLRFNLENNYFDIIELG